MSKIIFLFFISLNLFAKEYIISAENKLDLKSFDESVITDLKLKNANVYLYNGPIEKVQKIDGLVHIEENIDLKINADLYEKQWHLKNTGWNSRRYIFIPGKEGEDIDAEKAWEITKGSREVVIAVLDSGIDLTHPNLQSNIWINEKELNGVEGVDDDGNGYVDDINGYDFINDDNDPTDDNGHGSHCAGIIGAAHIKDGIKGVMANVRIMPLKFIPKNGVGKLHAVLKAIDYAIENGAQVLSNSWGGATKGGVLFEMMKKASDKGIVIVAAAGNAKVNNDYMPSYPAGYDLPGLLSVGASASRGDRARFSNYGKNSIDVFAPGMSIYSTHKEGNYKYMSGTSMAAPVVSGIIGLGLSIAPEKTPEELRELLIETSEKIPALFKVSVGGRVNAFEFLKRVGEK